MLTSLNPTGKQETTDVIAMISNFDSTGVLSRSFQIMKVINRLIYFDIEYGSILTAFLESAEIRSGIPKQSKDS